MPKRWLIITIAIFCAVTILGYSLLLNQTFQEKLGWHLNQWAGKIRTWLNPPQEVTFSSTNDDDPQDEPLTDPVIITVTPIPTEKTQDTYSYRYFCTHSFIVCY